jgi:hypothetical protein
MQQCSPFWHCAASGHHELCEILVERGADPRVKRGRNYKVSKEE